MKYTYVNNGMSKLIIVFNSFINNKDMTSEQLQKKISFPSLPLDHDKYDFLYVQDAYCKTFGWYAIDNGTYIYQELADELDEFIIQNNYLKKDVTSFGSSKGGYGALLHGLLCKNIGSVYSAVPQINLTDYFTQTSLVEDKRFDDLQNYGKMVTNILPNIKVDKDTKVTLYTGINDSMIKSQLSFMSDLQKKLKSEIHVKVRIGAEKHNELVIKHNDILLSSFKRTLEGKEIDSNLFPVINAIEVDKILTYSELIEIIEDNINTSLEKQLDYISIPEFISDYEIAMYFYYSNSECVKVDYNKYKKNKLMLNEKLEANLRQVTLFVREESELSTFHINY